MSGVIRKHGLPVRWLLPGLCMAGALTVILWYLLRPGTFWDLWLTPDQQGRWWFHRGEYLRAAQHFDDARWQAFSLYGAEEFTAAAERFSRYTDASSELGAANALAHAREYLDARDAYRRLLADYPDHPGATTNIAIVQGLIDANRRLSESQQSEPGEQNAFPGEEAGPRSSEGDEREGVAVNLQQKQLSADALLDDPALTEVWLRQVQRDPGEFLSSKFYRQLQQQGTPAP